MNPSLHGQGLAELERQAAAATEAGQWPDAARLWARVLELDPRHVTAHTRLGDLALRRGDASAALASFRRAAELDGRDPWQWVNVARACEALRDEPGAEAALSRALQVNPYDLLALLMRAQQFERLGRPHAAAAAYGAAADVAPPLPRVVPPLRAAVEHAQRYRADYQRRYGDFLDQALAPLRQQVRGADRERFDRSVDLLVGRRKRFDSQPMLHYMPGLLPTEFFERSRFPWLDAIEAGTDVIRDEFLAVLASDAGFAPYIQYGVDQPVAQWAQLNHNPDWSAFHLVKSGRPVAGNAERCPRTMELWRGVPSPQQPGRTPVALFSLLKPRTHIPPHVGASNARLLTHLPLIIPPGCSFRVGNTVREWVPGQAWVFDDTIEHEARNDSDRLRVIMIFDIWHPDLSPDEQRLMTALAEAMNTFNADTAAGYDA